MRLIDADALPTLKTELRLSNGKTKHFVGVEFDDIRNAPTIEAVKVSNGEWLLMPTKETDTYYYLCSECGKLGVLTTEANKPIMKYCPHCGAKMAER